MASIFILLVKFSRWLMYCERFYGAVISISVEYNGSNDILTNTADTCVYMSCILGLHDKLDLFI